MPKYISFEDELNMAQLGNRLTNAMNRKRITRRTLADNIGVNEMAVGYWCRGMKAPNAVNVVKICKELEISADYLLLGKG